MGRLGDLLATKPFLAMFLQHLNRWSTKKMGWEVVFPKRLFLEVKRVETR